MATKYQIAETWPASGEAVAQMIASPVDPPDNGAADGRSEFKWVRFSNGDLALLVWPHGDTYVKFDEGGDAEIQYALAAAAGTVETIMLDSSDVEWAIENGSRS